MPRFCIVIPNYNGAATLREAVDSALSVQHHDFSVVVSDNASTDGSAGILSEYDDSRLTVRRHESTLPKSENWIRAYGEADDCEYFVNLHSDDRLTPDALIHIERAARSRPALIHGAARSIAFSGQALPRRPEFPLPYRTSGLAARQILLLNNIVHVVGTAIRSDAYEMVGGWSRDFVFFQDVQLWFDLADVGEIRYTPRRFGDYRQQPVRDAPTRFPVEYVEWYCDKAERFARTPLGEIALNRVVEFMEHCTQRYLQGKETPHEEWRAAVERAYATSARFRFRRFNSIRRQRRERLWHSARTAFGLRSAL